MAKWGTNSKYHKTNATQQEHLDQQQDSGTFSSVLTIPTPTGGCGGGKGGRAEGTRRVRCQLG